MSQQQFEETKNRLKTAILLFCRHLPRGSDLWSKVREVLTELEAEILREEIGRGRDQEIGKESARPKLPQRDSGGELPPF